jgi:hypothetical protein
MIRNATEWLRRRIHGVRSVLLSYRAYLFLLGDDRVELVAYAPDENAYETYRVRHDRRADPVALELHRGPAITEDELLARVSDAKLVDTIPLRFVAPDGRGLDGEDDGPAGRHDTGEDD